MRCAMLAVLLLGVPVAPLLAQETLAWKFKKGSSFLLERVDAQKQTVETKGKTLERSSTTTWLTRFDVLKAGDKEIVLEQTIVAVNSKNAAGPKAEAEMLEKFKEKLKGSKFRVTMTPAGRIRKFEGYEELVKKLSDHNNELERTVRFLLPEVSLRDGLEEAFGFLPENAVSAGAKWQRGAIESMAPFGSFKTGFHYRYEGRMEGLDKITCTMDSAYVPPMHDLGLVRVIKGSLRAEDGKGTVTFDARQGRLIRGERRVTMRGTLTLQTGPRQTSQFELTSVNQLTWRLMEVKKD